MREINTLAHSSTTESAKKAVLVAPFWHHVDHVGVLRMERFRRWLADAGVEIVLVTGGEPAVIDHEWGHEVRVRDPLGRYRGPNNAVPKRQAPSLKGAWSARMMGYILTPDSGIAWARRAAADERVLRYAAGADLILSSSPPESAHIAGYRLARKLNARHVVDLRDGWLDSPLKLLLRESRLQRWREGRIEARVLSRAHRIFVTSDIWRDLLVGRYPAKTDTCTVLTNALPVSASLLDEPPQPEGSAGSLIVRYTGRLGASHVLRRVDDLLRPFKATSVQPAGRIELIGPFTAAEQEAIAVLAKKLRLAHWDLVTLPPQPRDRALELQRGAGGLLLLSAGLPYLPAKLFEYLATGRPILAISPPGSAVWRLGERTDQIFNYPLGQVRADKVRAFLEVCKVRQPFEPPRDFSDSACRHVCLEALSIGERAPNEFHRPDPGGAVEEGGTESRPADHFMW